VKGTGRGARMNNNPRLSVQNRQDGTFIPGVRIDFDDPVRQDFDWAAVIPAVIAVLAIIVAAIMVASS